ncbi:MAG TPA: hypothetical protein VFL82_13515 [Thermomicrobiales bacterium]|nr:hypothetical protein [Thermomicrobiales bacterium]
MIKEVGQIVVLKDAPIVAAAIWARADTLASYDRKHLLRQAATIHDHFGIIVATPEIILARQ